MGKRFAKFDGSGALRALRFFSAESTTDMETPRTEAEQFERIRTGVFQTSDEAVGVVAASIAHLIRQRQQEARNAVLGLATGSTPVKLYRELIRLHRNEGLSFRNVVTFNLDEYYGLPPHHPESYRHFMEVQLFSHVDVPRENVHVPDGMIARSEVFRYCQEYERAIRDAGGVDLQILGIGRTGHIGFNEPGSGIDSRTRMVALDRLTRRDAARDFRGEANVPGYAITMGVGTILQAKELALLAWGESKAAILRAAIEGPQTETVPASFLQRHSNCRSYIDEAAAGELTRIRFPWKVGPVDWKPQIIRKAVASLASDLKNLFCGYGTKTTPKMALPRCCWRWVQLIPSTFVSLTSYNIRSPAGRVENRMPTTRTARFRLNRPASGS